MESQDKSLEDLLNELKEKTRRKIEFSSVGKTSSVRGTSPIRRASPTQIGRASFAPLKSPLSTKTPLSNRRATAFDKALAKLEKERRTKKSFSTSKGFFSKEVFKKVLFSFLALLLGTSLLLFLSKENPATFQDDLARTTQNLKQQFLDFFSFDSGDNLATFDNEIISIDRLHTVKTYIPIISSPQLLTPDRLFFANRSGYVFLMNPISGELINRYVLSEFPQKEKIDVVASPLHLQLKDNTHGILYVHANGEFTALNNQANYLYRSEKGIFDEETIYTTPVSFLSENNLERNFVVATMQGNIRAFQLERGNVVWQTSIENESFFATPLVDQSELLLVGLSGELYKIDLNSGNLLWRKPSSLGPSVKASPVMLKTSNGKRYYLILSSSGNLGLYNQDGKEMFIQSIGEPMVASASIQQKNQAIVATLDGNVYKITVEDNFEDGNIEAKIDFLFGKKGASFVSRPIVLPHTDVSEKNAFFILLSDRNGTLFIIDDRGNERALKPLDYHVSATPIVADINGDAQLEIIVAGENGHVEIFRLATTNPLSSIENRFISTGFLDFHR